jgi:hypothetical protein
MMKKSLMTMRKLPLFSPLLVRVEAVRQWSTRKYTVTRKKTTLATWGLVNKISLMM